MKINGGSEECSHTGGRIEKGKSGDEKKPTEDEALTDWKPY